MAVPVIAAPPSPADADFFERQVRPVLSEQCWSCHGPKKQTAGLRLDPRPACSRAASPARPLTRRTRARACSSGDAPRGRAEDAAQDEARRRRPWTPSPSGSAAAPRGRRPRPERSSRLAKALGLSGRSTNPVPPVDPNDHWSRTAIDRFVWAKLRDKGLTPSAEADKRILIRRLTFDLTGLPPTPEEVEAFLTDDGPRPTRGWSTGCSPRPAYGERWGRHWLDVARYADTKGYVFFEERELPWAYTYRDYVIRAFNEDLPFDRFLDRADSPPTGCAGRRQAAAGGAGVPDRRPALHEQHPRHHRRPDRRRDPRAAGPDGRAAPAATTTSSTRSRPTTITRSTASSPAARSRPIRPLYRQPPPKTEAYEKFARELASPRAEARDVRRSEAQDELDAGPRTRGRPSTCSRPHAACDQPATRKTSC